MMMGIAEKVFATIADSKYGMLATCDDLQPRVRPHAFVISSKGTFWTSTYSQSGKYGELCRNGNCEICFVDSGLNQVRVVGQALIVHGYYEKSQLLVLNPKVRRHFPSPDDVNFVMIEIIPSLLKWKATGYNEYELISGDEWISGLSK